MVSAPCRPGLYWPGAGDEPRRIYGLGGPEPTTAATARAVPGSPGGLAGCLVKQEGSGPALATAIGQPIGLQLILLGVILAAVGPAAMAFVTDRGGCMYGLGGPDPGPDPTAAESG